MPTTEEMIRLERVTWLWSRLRAMGPREVGWRLQERWRTARESYRAGRGGFRSLAEPTGEALRGELARALAPLVPPAAWRERLAREFPEHAERLAARSRAIREGRVEIFGTVHEVGHPPDWQRDPGSGVRAPDRPAARIDYRNRERVGSARRLWELSRHHHVVELAQHAWLARDGEAGRAAVDQLVDWCERNPPHWGVHWTSSLELAIRTLAWAEILALLLDVEEAALDDRTLALLCGAWVRQVEHVRAHDSRYSSANNHRIGEAAAVAFAGYALAFHPRAAEWRGWGRRTLEEEIELQIAPDGVGLEQAFAYQRFVLDFAIVVRVMARGHGEDLAPATVERLHAAAEFLGAVTRPDGSPFPVGDDDEGQAFALGEPWEERTRATLETAGWLWHEPAWRRCAFPRARWLGLAPDASGGDASSESDGLPEASGLRARAFREGGYATVAGRAGGRELRLLFDAGPLGLGALAAHGHADALALAFWWDGDRLVDPGTGSYHGDPVLREALRGTAAHNTCRVDDADQSERRGLFLWGRRARAELLAAGAKGPWFVLAGRHDGYARRGVPRLRRLVAGHAGAGGLVLVVVDEAIGTGEHALATPWHVGPGRLEPAEAEPADFRVRYPDGARLHARAAALGTPSPLRTSRTPGGEGTRGSWYAPRFERAEPGGRFEAAVTARLPAALAWVITVPARGGEPGEDETVRFEPCEGGLRATVRRTKGETLKALIAAPEARVVQAAEARLEGRLAFWQESEAGEAPTEIAVLGARRLVSGRFVWTGGPEPVSGVLAALGAAGPAPATNGRESGR